MYLLRSVTEARLVIASRNEYRATNNVCSVAKQFPSGSPTSYLPHIGFTASSGHGVSIAPRSLAGGVQRGKTSRDSAKVDTRWACAYRSAEAKAFKGSTSLQWFMPALVRRAQH